MAWARGEDLDGSEDLTPQEEDCTLDSEYEEDLTDEELDDFYNNILEIYGLKEEFESVQIRTDLELDSGAPKTTRNHHTDVPTSHGEQKKDTPQTRQNEKVKNIIHPPEKVNNIIHPTEKRKNFTEGEKVSRNKNH